MALSVASGEACGNAGHPDPLALLRHARVLVVTPHPDDESLAAGGLIQHALHVGAQVHVLQVTDGDNNPWPQRVLERRIVIGSAGRKRWAERRRGEVQTATTALGLPEQNLLHMSWPDMGVTRRLREWDLRAINAFEQRIQALQPTLVVLPALGDTHPDHGSVHVLMHLALARQDSSALCLEYLIHGCPDAAAQSVTFELSTQMQACKREAVLAHASQVALSRKRLLAHVQANEHFQCAHRDADTPLPGRMPLPWKAPRWPTRQMHLTLAHHDGVNDWPLQDAPVQRAEDGRLQLVLPEDISRRSPMFVRLDMRVPSPWIFDLWGWHRLTATPAMTQA